MAVSLKDTTFNTNSSITDDLKRGNMTKQQEVFSVSTETFKVVLQNFGVRV
jgi:hypothetical protein